EVGIEGVTEFLVDAEVAPVGPLPEPERGLGRELVGWFADELEQRGRPFGEREVAPVPNQDLARETRGCIGPARDIGEPRSEPAELVAVAEFSHPLGEPARDGDTDGVADHLPPLAEGRASR